jgi:transcriptional regulator with XRE-family HTH domain
MSVRCYQWTMSQTRSTSAHAQAHLLGAAVVEIRATIRWSQHELSRRSGVPQSMISRIERGKLENPPLATIAVLLESMGGRLRVQVDPPFLLGRRGQLDAAHARMSGHIARRLEGKGWRVVTEVEVGGDRSRGWIDLLAFHPVTRLVLVIEAKTEIHDLGQIDRTLSWYEREAWAAARRIGWRPAAVTGCLLLLMTDQNDTAVRFNQESLKRLFPIRTSALCNIVEGTAPTLRRRSRGLAMVDPRSKRRAWLRPTSDDGRRTPPPYLHYAHFMRLLVGH